MTWDKLCSKLFFDPRNKESALQAVTKKGFNIRYIRNPDKEIQIAAVKQNGVCVQVIHNPCKQAQLESIKSSLYNIRWIQKPLKSVQLAAIRQSGYDLGIIALCPNWEDFKKEIEDFLICKDIIE
jgi:hypothetical protein